MKKTPIKIYIIATILIFYGIQTIRIALTNPSIELEFNYIWAAGAFFTSILLILRKAWSQYLAYFFFGDMVFEWMHIVWLINRDGWAYDDFSDITISLIPGILFVAVCIWSCIAVFKYFRSIKET
jgi:hypothetical protein